MKDLRDWDVSYINHHIGGIIGTAIILTTIFIILNICKPYLFVISN